MKNSTLSVWALNHHSTNERPNENRVISFLERKENGKWIRSGRQGIVAIPFGPLILIASQSHILTWWCWREWKRHVLFILIFEGSKELKSNKGNCFRNYTFIDSIFISIFLLFHQEYMRCGAFIRRTYTVHIHTVRYDTIYVHNTIQAFIYLILLSFSTYKRDWNPFNLAFFSLFLTWKSLALWLDGWVCQEALSFQLYRSFNWTEAMIFDILKLLVFDSWEEGEAERSNHPAALNQIKCRPSGRWSIESTNIVAMSVSAGSGRWNQLTKLSIIRVVWYSENS